MHMEDVVGMPPLEVLPHPYTVAPPSPHPPVHPPATAASATPGWMSPPHPHSPLRLPLTPKSTSPRARAPADTLYTTPATHRPVPLRPWEPGDLTAELHELEAEIASATACMAATDSTPHAARPRAAQAFEAAVDGLSRADDCAGLSIEQELTCMAEEAMAVVSGGGGRAGADVACLRVWVHGFVSVCHHVAWRVRALPRGMLYATHGWCLHLWRGCALAVCARVWCAAPGHADVCTPERLRACGAALRAFASVARLR